jgi:hypothetical protein
MPQITNARLSCSNLKSRSVHRKKVKIQVSALRPFRFFAPADSDWCCMQLMIFFGQLEQGISFAKVATGD